MYFHGLANQDTNEMRQRFKHHTEKSKYLNEHINEKGYTSIMHITDLEIEKY